MSSGTVILPIAGRSSRFPGTRPKWLLTAPTGQLMLQLALDSVPGWHDRRVVIGALREHLHELSGEGAIRRALGQHPEIVEFEKPTSGPAETVSEIIRRANITGSIFIKDCDSWFVTHDDVFDDVVCYADLRSTPSVDNVAAKSFLLLNENMLLVGMIEKSVASNYISVGGYGFHDAASYLAWFGLLRSQAGSNELFVSHVIESALAKGAAFRGCRVDNYADVGTLDAWHRFRGRQATYFVDIDGVIFANSGLYTPPFYEDPDRPLMPNIELLKGLVDAGAQLVLLTARPEQFRAKTEKALRELGLRWHSAIFELNHARRLLINDFAPTNPFPSAIAINVTRDSERLTDYVAEINPRTVR